MRILILSDLHHEIWLQFAPTIDPSVSQPDIVVLAGDIDTGTKAVEWAAKTFPKLPVLYVHGNHEAYGNNLDDVQTKIETACMATDNVHFLNCTEFKIGRVRFLGALGVDPQQHCRIVAATFSDGVHRHALVQQQGFVTASQLDFVHSVVCTHAPGVVAREIFACRSENPTSKKYPCVADGPHVSRLCLSRQMDKVELSAGQF